MNVTRTPRPEVKAISTATRIIELAEGQMFYTTPKAWEIWQERPGELLRRIKRFDRKNIYWIFPK